MSNHINTISARLSLRQPQKRALEILNEITNIVPLKKEVNLSSYLEHIKDKFQTISDFEREFPSFCFSLATGVGKTRLMGAFITYLHLAHGINNFFVLAPNLTIYNKLITDFSDRNHPKYVFKGISEFAVNQPSIVTGDNYEKHDPLSGSLLGSVKINIFNISKITSEVRGSRSPRIKRLCEYIGQSYFDELAGLPDLVLLMDESHRYRASAGLKAINELKPVLGLELTATPYIETSKGPISFKNIIYNYSLGSAIADGFVKEPAVVTRKDFNPSKMSSSELESIKLEDGLRLHESIKVHLETYARETNNNIIKPFLLVISRDTTHATQLLELIKSDKFFGGRYKEKVIQVDSSKTGAAEEEMINRLLKVESSEEPTEIVIHVNMLKEGWDVTNLYTIVPLRAANARVLIEQSIGRGLRLPYGKRTGVDVIDTLNIISHDKFQEIIEESKKPDSLVQLKSIELNLDELDQKNYSVISRSKFSASLGLVPNNMTANTIIADQIQPDFNEDELKVAQVVNRMINKFENEPDKVPTVEHLRNSEIISNIVKEVEGQYSTNQLEFKELRETLNIASIVEKTIDMAISQTINIPRIFLTPKNTVKSGFKKFSLKLDTLNYPPISEELWVQHLRTNKIEIISLEGKDIEETRLEDYIVSGLIDFNDISYDDNADLLYDLASQVVRHFSKYLNADQTRKVLCCHQNEIARYIHSQMIKNYWEDPVEFEVITKKGFTDLRQPTYTCALKENLLNYTVSPNDKSNMSKYLFNGFARCLYTVQKFDSDTERRFAAILERDSIKWFKPIKGQFMIFYRIDHEYFEYQPDFVVETNDWIFMIEIKMRKELENNIVLAKREAAIKWCKHATEYSLKHGAKPWQYLLIPHDEIAENIVLTTFAEKFSDKALNFL